jgi:hypothetical protein
VSTPFLLRKLLGKSLYVGTRYGRFLLASSVDQKYPIVGQFLLAYLGKHLK